MYIRLNKIKSLLRFSIYRKFSTAFSVRTYVSVAFHFSNALCRLLRILYPPHCDLAEASLPNRIRALAFYLTTFAMSVPLFIVMLVVHPFVMLFDRVRRLGHHFTNTLWATASTKPFYG